jgi:hypothetical protein
MAGILRADEHGVGKTFFRQRRLPIVKDGFGRDPVLADQGLPVELAGLGHADNLGLIAMFPDVRRIALAATSGAKDKQFYGCQRLLLPARHKIRHNEARARGGPSAIWFSGHLAFSCCWIVPGALSHAGVTFAVTHPEKLVLLGPRRRRKDMP